MADKLAKYRSMRDFGATSEPAGGSAPAAEGDALRFVIQEHHATRLHWDLRLEHEGALASWAVPNFLPEVPHENRLAVRTEEHPIEYLDFHGEIPEGSYGAGSMTIWDRGTFTVEEWDDAKKVTVVLDGERIGGRYALFHIGPERKDWMVHRMDAPLDPEREPMPRRLVPMLAPLGDVPAGDGWSFEVLWPGERVTVVSEPGRLHLYTADQREVTDALPEIRPVNRALSSEPAVLEGVLVAFGPDGRPDPERVRRRLSARGDSAARRGAREAPVTLVLVDALYLHGRSLLQYSHAERRERLEALELDGPAWRTPAVHADPAVVEAARAQGLPGALAKRTTSRYVPGAVAHGDWVQVGGDFAALDRRALHARARGATPGDPEVLLNGEGVLRIEGGDDERVEAALALRGMLEQLQLRSFPLVAAGELLVWVPFEERSEREAVGAFLGAVAATADRALAARVRAEAARAPAPYVAARPVGWAHLEGAPEDDPDADPLAPALSTPQPVPG